MINTINTRYKKDIEAITSEIINNYRLETELLKIGIPSICHKENKNCISLRKNFWYFSGGTYNKIDFDLTDIKQKLAEFKAEQKQRPAKDRKNHHPIFALGNTGYNAEYFIDIAEALGTDAVLYQNEKSSGISYFESEYGKAILCPCRL